MRNLMEMGARPPIYASFGTELALADLLPGVGIEVLGPPTLEQSAEIASRARNGSGRVLAPCRRGPGRRSRGGRRPPPLFPDAALAGDAIPQEARWVIPEIERMRSEEMLAIVRSLDSVLNNTSLILLFEIGEHAAAVPGRRADRELELRAVHGAEPRSDPRAARDRELLQGRPPRQPQRDAEDALEAVRARWRGRHARPARHDGLDGRRQARQRGPGDGGAAQGR